MLPRGRPAPPTALCQVPLKPLPQVFGKAVSRPPGRRVPGGRVSPHVSMGRATCPPLWAAALRAAQPCGVSLTTRGIAPACLRYDRLTLVARVAGPLCLAGNPFLDCVPARLSQVASMAPGDVCHGPRCSLAGLGPVALEYRSCHWPGGLAGSPQCVRPVGCWFLPVPSPPYVSAVSWATWLLFIGVPAGCVVLHVRCPKPLGSCSPVCPLGVLCCMCGVLGHLAAVHRSARLVCCVACAVSWATWLLFTGEPAPWVVLRVRFPRPLGSCSPVCLCGLLFCVCGVLGHLAPLHRCARSVCCAAYAVSWATWLPFTSVLAGCVVLRVRCPGPLGSCLTVYPFRPLLCLSGVLGHLAPVHWCACSVLALGVRCPGPLCSRSPVCPLGVLCCVCGVLGLLAPVHRCARWVRCVACAVSWATWLLFTGVPARCFVLRVRVLGHFAPVHRCARSVRCFACAVSWATWLLFTGVPARCVLLRARCPRPLGSCSPVCLLRPLLCLCRVLGHLAPVHRCARSVCCFACAVSWATWLLFTSVPARWVVLLRVRCPGPLGSCSPVCQPDGFCCVYGVLGPLALVHRCARSGCCVGCAVSWAPWLLSTGVLARCLVLWVARAVLRVRGVAAGRALAN